MLVVESVSENKSILNMLGIMMKIQPLSCHWIRVFFSGFYKHANHNTNAPLGNKMPWPQYWQLDN